MTASLKRKTTVLDSAFQGQTAVLKQNMLLHRQVKGDSRSDPAFDSLNKQLVPGAVLTDKAFVSTSAASEVNRFMGARLIQMTIKAAKGSRGIVAGTTGRFKLENEVILPRGSRFKVVSRKDSVGGVFGKSQITHVTVELQ